MIFSEEYAYMAPILFSVLAAVVSTQILYSGKWRGLGFAGAFLSICFFGYGIMAFVNRPEPCDGVETLEGASMETMECIARLVEIKIPDK